MKKLLDKAKKLVNKLKFKEIRHYLRNRPSDGTVVVICSETEKENLLAEVVTGLCESDVCISYFDSSGILLYLLTAKDIFPTVPLSTLSEVAVELMSYWKDVFNIREVRIAETNDIGSFLYTRMLGLDVDDIADCS